MDRQPSPTVANGRGANGRFAAGNRLGQGNPNARRAQKLRTELMKSVEADDFKRIFRSLVNTAAVGDVAAANLILDSALDAGIKMENYLLCLKMGSCQNHAAIVDRSLERCSKMLEMSTHCTGWTHTIRSSPE